MYRTNFILIQEHKYSLSELENMIPWEREIYLNMLIKHVEDINKKRDMLNKKK